MIKRTGCKPWEKLSTYIHNRTENVSDVNKKLPTRPQGEYEYVNLSEIPSEKFRATFMPKELSDKLKPSSSQNKVNQLKQLKRND